MWVSWLYSLCVWLTSTVNCGAFPPIQVENLDPSSLVTKITFPGLCDSYKMSGASRRVLTHAPEFNDLGTKAVEARRRAQCPKARKNRPGFCEQQNKSLKEAFDSSSSSSSSKTPVTECEEFPWASSEEGGKWLNPGGRSRVCVPSVQNGRGGACVSMF